MKKYCVAAVTDHRATVMQFEEETVRHGGKSRRRLQRRAVHALGRFDLQNFCVTETAVLQMSNHKVRHVRRRCRAAARGSGHNQLIGAWGSRCRSIALRSRGRESLG